MRGAVKALFGRERCEKGNEKADQSHFFVEKDVKREIRHPFKAVFAHKNDNKGNEEPNQIPFYIKEG